MFDFFQQKNTEVDKNFFPPQLRNDDKDSEVTQKKNESSKLLPPKQ